MNFKNCVQMKVLVSIKLMYMHINDYQYHYDKHHVKIYKII